MLGHRQKMWLSERPCSDKCSAYQIAALFDNLYVSQNADNIRSRERRIRDIDNLDLAIGIDHEQAGLS